MSNSLYRKHRPKKFEDVVGQEFITTTLQNQIKNNNISHAYLFCGTRGSGKTTVAKIFANAVNDYKTSDIDIFEIDAASNNGVDAVRELIEKVKYPPVNAKYKVYIIDEVHMFSTAAFNALLKTLEEPPSYVIFILATTEPHKLLPTVLSRCVRFDFKSASVPQIAEVLTKVLKKENIKAEKQVIEAIAKEGRGSYRDALSIAETVSNYDDKKIEMETIIKVLGSVKKQTLENLLLFIEEKNLEKIKNTITEIFSAGINISAIIKDLLEIIKNKYVESKNKKYMEHYKLFACLEINIKTATDIQSILEGTCLLCTTI